MKQTAFIRLYKIRLIARSLVLLPDDLHLCRERTSPRVPPKGGLSDHAETPSVSGPVTWTSARARDLPADSPAAAR